MAEPTIAAPAPKPEDDPFGAAFALGVEADAKAAEPPAATDPVTDAAVGEEAGKGAPAKLEIEGVLPNPAEVKPDGTVPGAEPEAKPAAETKPAADPAAGAPKMSDAELLEQFRSVMAAPKLEPPAPAPAAKVEPPSPISPYTDEEKALVENYQKEWSDVYLAEQAIRKREYQAVVDHIFKTLAPVLEQLQGQTTTLATDTHMQRLHAAVPDYDEVAPKVVAWVDTQPAYLKAAYKHVVSNGEVTDVVDLISRYRAETGTAAPTAKPAAPVEPAPKPAVARVIKGLAPVGSKRTGVQQDAIQPDDFDGAFAAFAAASKAA